MRQAPELEPPVERAATQPAPPTRKPPPTTVARRWAAIAGAFLLLLLVGAWMLRSDEFRPPRPEKVPGTPAWALEHYGDSQQATFKRRNIAEIEFLGRSMFVHRDARRHFLRLERLFEARAPDYSAGVAVGELDDWSYDNRNVRGATVRSNHAFDFIGVPPLAFAQVRGPFPTKRGARRPPDFSPSSTELAEDQSSYPGGLVLTDAFEQVRVNR